MDIEERYASAVDAAIKFEDPSFNVRIVNYQPSKLSWCFTWFEKQSITGRDR